MRKMKMYLTTYQTKSPDYEALTKRAGEIKIKIEFGGGRKTKGGESPNAQIMLNLKEINSKILISRTGRIIIYYPSKLCLQKCVETLVSVYAPGIRKSDLKCQGPKDPLSKTFELKTTENWNGTGRTLYEATVMVNQWLDRRTGEYTFVLPDDDGRVVCPTGSDFKYAGCAPIRIQATDKDDKSGNRIVTGERILWQAMQELRRMSRENRLTPEDMKRAKEREKPQCERKSLDDVDIIFLV
jgi:hypothetical protein